MDNSHFSIFIFQFRSDVCEKLKIENGRLQIADCLTIATVCAAPEGPKQDSPGNALGTMHDQQTSPVKGATSLHASQGDALGPSSTI
jgi:hypothetical protein